MKRHLLENFFCKLKHYRRVATRSEKTAATHQDRAQRAPGSHFPGGSDADPPPARQSRIGAPHPTPRRAETSIAFDLGSTRCWLPRFVLVASIKSWLACVQRFTRAGGAISWLNETEHQRDRHLSLFIFSRQNRDRAAMVELDGDWQEDSAVALVGAAFDDVGCSAPWFEGDQRCACARKSRRCAQNEPGKQGKRDDPPGERLQPFVNASSHGGGQPRDHWPREQWRYRL